MPFLDRSPAVFGHVLGKARIVQKSLYAILHFLPVGSHQKILATSEKVFRVFPRRTNKRDFACKSLERTDRRNTRQFGCIGPARDMNCDVMGRKHFRNSKIWQPTRVFYS